MKAGGSHESGVLFVCLGNICRSPLAEWVFRAEAERRGVLSRLLVGSCGTGGWHEGEGADPRTLATAERHGLRMRHTARQLRPETDFARHELLIAMDRTNERDMMALGAPRDRVRLMRSFDPSFLGGSLSKAPDVPDPYYGGPDGFEEVYGMLRSACAGLVEHVVRSIGKGTA